MTCASRASRLEAESIQLEGAVTVTQATCLEMNDMHYAEGSAG